MKKHNKGIGFYVSMILAMITVFLAITFVMLGCSSRNHNSNTDGNGSLTVRLIWEDKLTSSNEIRSINLWIYDKTEYLAVSEIYSSPSSLLERRFKLKEGNCNILMAVNLHDEIKEEHTATVEDLKEELERQAGLYAETYYGDKTFEVVGAVGKSVDVELHDKPEVNSLCSRCGVDGQGLVASHKYLCGLHECVDGIVADEHKAADCGAEGHFVCDTKDHSTRLECGHLACDDGEHSRLECEEKHFACDEQYGVQGCGHCLCEGEDFLCPICNKWNCEVRDTPHEKYYCGHILCVEGMEQGHENCEYCGQCITYGAHSADGCVPPEDE